MKKTTQRKNAFRSRSVQTKISLDQTIFQRNPEHNASELIGFQSRKFRRIQT